MSTTVDERVVSMQFDNADFEKGVQQTLNSLNTLNKNISILHKNLFFLK